MKWFAFASLFLLALLASSVLVVFSFVGSVGGATVGVYIQADGTVYGTVVDGTDSIQRDGDVYTFVGDIAYPLYVERDNIVIDGAGYTLVSGETNGVVLADRRNVTLQNARVVVGKGRIIDVAGAADCALVGNTFVGNPQPIPDLPPPVTPLTGPIGVSFTNSQDITVRDNTITNFFYALALEQSSGHTIIGNTFVDGVVGIYISGATGCVFRNNSIVNSGFYVTVYYSSEYDNDLDSSNTIDGKPIYYWRDVEGAVVPSDAAYVVLLRCRNMVVENISPQRITLVSTSNSTIRCVEFTGRNSGIALLGCSGISILDNTLHDGSVGIDLQNSFSNLISGNKLLTCITSSIRLTNASTNFISGNSFTNNSEAISVSSFHVPFGTGNVITSNNFTENAKAIVSPSSMDIVGNNFEENYNAICLSECSGSFITQNTFKYNTNALCLSNASGNCIYWNNFLSNEHHVTDAGVDTAQPSAQLAKASSSGSLQLAVARFGTVNWFPPPPPSTNYWDNGAQGNYWSDYTGKDANKDGVGDTAYYLYQNNQDNYPLMTPVEVSELSTPPTANPEDTVTAELPTAYIVVAIIASVAVIAVVGACLFLKRQKPQNDL